MKFKRLFVAAVALSLFTGGSGEVVWSQEAPKEDPIHFLTPKSFKCGANIPWDELTKWYGEGGKCGQGLLHKVIGQVPAVKDGFVKAKIIVPEDNGREWPAYNGEVHKINNNKFEVSFCITSRLATRPIWIQAYSKDGKKSGGRCTVTLVGVQLED